MRDEETASESGHLPVEAVLGFRMVETDLPGDENRWL